MLSDTILEIMYNIVCIKLIRIHVNDEYDDYDADNCYDDNDDNDNAMVLSSLMITMTIKETTLMVIIMILSTAKWQQ